MKIDSIRTLPAAGFFCLLALAIVVASGPAAARAQSPSEARILIVVGPSNHPPGSHEVAAGAKLVEHCLENAGNLRGAKAQVVHQWPHDRALLDQVSTVVFLGDQFPPERMENSDAIMRELSAMAKRGCGIVCLHYATGLAAQDVADDGDHPLLHWIGGYFATRCKHHQSVAKVLQATIEPATGNHPVLQGWTRFTLHDEPYYRNYFGPDGMADNVTPLAVSMLPPDAPQQEVVAWAVERSDGGRGFGIVMPHFYRNWRDENLRKLILNGIVWTARMEVPEMGVETELPDLAQ